MVSPSLSTATQRVADGQDIPDRTPFDWLGCSESGSMATGDDQLLPFQL
jgi:hypothetical protein